MPDAVRRCVAVVGPGDGATDADVEAAEEVARLAAARGWVVLCGGYDLGVMAAAARGAAAADGLSIGILSGADRRQAAPALTVALPTALGEARNAVLVAAADAVVGCGISPGTASEIALALRNRKPTVLVGAATATVKFYRAIGAVDPPYAAASAGDAISWIAGRLV